MLTENTCRQIIANISDQHHAPTGAVIALAAAQAAALGEACMQISLDNQVDTLNWQDVTGRIEKMARLKENLLAWSDQTGKAVTERSVLRQAGSEIGNQRFWFESAAEIGRLALDAATLLIDFRPLVFTAVADDVEITVSLLAGTAHSATLLLASNFSIWPETSLREEYGAVLTELKEQVEQLTL